MLPSCLGYLSQPEFLLFSPANQFAKPWQRWACVSFLLCLLQDSFNRYAQNHLKNNDRLNKGPSCTFIAWSPKAGTRTIRGLYLGEPLQSEFVYLSVGIPSSSWLWVSMVKASRRRRCGVPAVVPKAGREFFSEGKSCAGAMQCHAVPCSPAFLGILAAERTGRPCFCPLHWVPDLWFVCLVAFVYWMKASSAMLLTVEFGFANHGTRASPSWLP